MKKIFTLLTVSLASSAAFAQFDEPELQKATQVILDGQHEYFLSVTNSEGEEYFYGKGNDWGTRTSAKMEIGDALTVRFSATTATVGGVEYNTVKFNNYVSDKGGWGAFVDCDGGLQAWVDGQGRTGDGLWQLTDLGNGQIQLSNLNAPGGLFSFTPNRATWSEDDQDYILAESQDAYGFDNRLWFVGARVDSVDVLDDMGEPTGVKRAAVSYGEAYSTWQAYDASVFNARKQISTWYWEDAGDGNVGYQLVDEYPTVAAAVEKAKKIYDNPNATVEELQAAYDEIIAAVDMLAVLENQELLADVTPEEPADLFEWGIMVNADFGGVKGTDGDLTGWNATLKGNDNHRQNDEYSNGSARISGFAESWTWNASHATGYGEFTQKVSLPEGLYILGVDMIATQQSTNKESSKGVELFVKSATQEFAIPVATANNAPEHFELAFQAEAGTFIVGVRENNTTCNWIAMDNWKLTYYGNTGMPLEQIELGKVVSRIADQHDGLAEIIAKETVVETYDATFDAASAAYENGGLAPEEYTALSDSLQSCYNALTASIRDYQYFLQCIETVEARIEEMKATSPACADELAEYFDEINEHYEARDWTRKEMDDILPTVSEIMGKYTNVQPGDDVTFYLNNPAFTENFSGWQVDGRTPGYMKNHGQGDNANADLCQEVPEENDGLAECYHALFDMHQTIKNLPKGLYTLSVQGFNRMDGGTEPAELYATFSDGSEQTVDIVDINKYKTEDRLYVHNNADGNPEWQSDAGRDGDTYWVPNGMTGAAWHFVNKSDGENYDYTNKFSILMKEDGDLTVGIRVKNDQQWVIWDNFKIVYEGSGTMVWVPTLEAEIESLDNKAASTEITTGGYKAIQDVIKEAEALIKNIEDATEDDCQAMLQKLQGQYKAIDENIALQAQIQSYYDALLGGNLEEKAADAEPDLQARYDAACELVNGDFDDLNNDELKAAIEEIKNVITLLKMPKGWEDATDQNPVDFSELIANRFFNVDNSEDPEEEPGAVQNHNFTEWQGKQFGTGGGEAANCGEVWNSGAFDAYQVLTGLPEGTYILACDGFLRNSGGSADSYKVLSGEMEATNWAFLYAESAEGKYSTQLHNVTEARLTQEDLDSLGITGGTSEFTADGIKYKAPDQLACADGFFKNGYLTNNNVTVKVGADGELRIGIKKVGAVAQDWVVVDNFSLYYLGKESTAETSGDEETPVDNIAVAPVQKAIYTITGVRVSSMAKPGLYIVNGKKVLVK